LDNFLERFLLREEEDFSIAATCRMKLLQKGKRLGKKKEWERKEC